MKGGILPQLKETSKPGEDVMKFFDKKTHGMLAMKKRLSNQSQDFQDVNESPKLDKLAVSQNEDHHLQQSNNNVVSSRQNIGHTARKEQKRLDEEQEEQEKIDEKMRMTDFALKLEELKDRIEVYEKLFLTRQPKYLQKRTKQVKTVGGRRKNSQDSNEKISPKDEDYLNQMPHKRSTRLRLSQINHGHKSMLNFPDILLSGKDENNNKLKKQSENQLNSEFKKQHTTAITPKNLSQFQNPIGSNDAIGSKNSRKFSQASDLPQVEIKEEENLQDDNSYKKQNRGHRHQLSQYAIQHNKDKLLKEELNNKNLYVKKIQQTDHTKVFEIKRRQQLDNSVQNKQLKKDLNSKSTPQLKYNQQAQNLVIQQRAQAKQENGNSFVPTQLKNSYQLPQIVQDKPKTSPRIDRLEVKGSKSILDQSKTNSSKAGDGKSKKKYIKRYQQTQQSQQYIKLEMSQDLIKPVIKETHISNYKQIISAKPTKISENHQSLMLNRPSGQTRNNEKLKNNQQSPQFHITGLSQNHLEKVYMKKNDSFVHLNSSQNRSKVFHKKQRSITNTIIETVLRETNTNRTQAPVGQQQSPRSTSMKKIKSQSQIPIYNNQQQLTQGPNQQLNISKTIDNGALSQTIYNENEKNNENRKHKQIEREEELRNSHSPFKNNKKLQALMDTYNQSRVINKQNKSQKKKGQNNNSKLNQSGHNDSIKAKKSEKTFDSVPEMKSEGVEKINEEPEVQIYKEGNEEM